MWDRSQQGQLQPGWPGRPGLGKRPEQADAHEDTCDAHETSLPGAAAADALEMAETSAAAWERVHNRQMIREFLRAVPRSEPEATLALLRVDGSTRVLTRAELSAAIDRLRPRQRQIMRLALEERWSRQRVCDYLKGISIKTFERDQVEALDILAQL